MKQFLLISILILTAFLRIWGIGFGLPYFEHPDEWAVADEALRMLRTGEFRPFSYTYPTLYLYAQVGVAALHYAWGATVGLYKNVSEIDPASFYVWGRLLTAILGTGSVALTALIGRRLYGWPVGLMAAALLAVLPAVSGDAHYVTVDTPSAFMTLLAFWAMLRMLGTCSAPDQASNNKARLWRAPVVPGLLVGLAASTKYTGGILIIALLITCLILAWQRTNQPISRLRMALLLMLMAGGAALLGFTLGTPMWLVEPQRLLADLESIARHYRSGHPGAESSQPALFYWEALRGQAWLLAWLVLAGLGLAAIRRRKADVLLLAVIVPFVLQLSSVRVVFIRNAMPLFPFILILAAAFVLWLFQSIERRLQQAPVPEQPDDQSYCLSPIAYRLLTLTTLILAFQPFSIALRDEWLRAQPTTRVLATQWVERHAPDGTRIWLEDQTLILPSRLRVMGGQPASSHSLQWYRDNAFRYLVTNASIARSDPARLASFGEPVAHFEATGQRHGHSFVIYDMGQSDVADQPRSPSGATLGAGAITLDGYIHPKQVQRGTTLTLALFWQVNRALAGDYTVFVHVIDAQGNTLAQRDMPPLDGSRPSSSWQVGELIRDDQDLPIPADIPAGIYRIVVGMYDAQTLVSINDNGPIDVGEVELR